MKLLIEVCQFTPRQSGTCTILPFRCRQIVFWASASCKPLGLNFRPWIQGQSAQQSHGKLDGDPGGWFTRRADCFPDDGCDRTAVLSPCRKIQNKKEGRLGAPCASDVHFFWPAFIYFLDCGERRYSPIQSLSKHMLHFSVLIGHIRVADKPGSYNIQE